MVATTALASALGDLPLGAMLTGSRIGTRAVADVADPGTIYLFVVRPSPRRLPHDALAHVQCHAPLPQQ